MAKEIVLTTRHHDCINTMHLVDINFVILFYVNSKIYEVGQTIKSFFPL